MLRNDSSGNKSLSRHILSDKTGTITSNNLRVISIATREKEYSLTHPSAPLSSSGDPSLHALLLNMLTNHSALSINHTEATDLIEFTDSISHAQSMSIVKSPVDSSSLSEIYICDSLEEVPTNFLPTNSEDANANANANDEHLEHLDNQYTQQVFCSSQDERVNTFHSFSFSRQCLMRWQPFTTPFCQEIKRIPPSE